MKFEIRKNSIGLWFAHLVARNGNILCASETYTRSSGAKKWVAALKRSSDAKVLHARARK